MRFRIRQMDADSNEEVRASENAYQKHLESFQKTSNSDLWKYFTNDFFHDGTIESIDFNPNLRTAVMQIECPNIRRLTENGDFEYVSIDFTCTFHNVCRFSIEDDAPQEWSPNAVGHSSYRYSEINTAIPEGLPGEEGDFYSLIIECLGGEQATWVELVFSQVNVIPREPGAFAIMCASPQFQVPIFSPNA